MMRDGPYNSTAGSRLQMALRCCACLQAFTSQTGDRLPIAAFAAWRTLAFVVFRSGELPKRMKLLLQPVQHALLTDRQPSILEVD